MERTKKEIKDLSIDLNVAGHSGFPMKEEAVIRDSMEERYQEWEIFEDLIDYNYVRSIAKELFGPVIDHYFRAELIGGEKISQKGPMILASNHSGNAFPHDAIVLDGLFWRQQGFKNETKFRSVYSPSLAATWWMRPFGIDDWWRRCGGVDMTFSNFDYLLKNGQKVIYYPEGIPGIGKGFSRKYQLQHFYSSFVILSVRRNIPVFPVYSVNSEYVNPTSITFKWLDRLSFKLLGIPFFPVPIVLLALIFPFMFYFAFPANMKFVIGDPIDVQKLLDELSKDPGHPDKEDYNRVAEQIRTMMQDGLNASVRKYGKKPYNVKNWFRLMKALGWKAFRYFPTGWPYIFVRHVRDMERPAAKNKLHAFFRDIDILFYYLPFGWFFLALSRKLRKPPYGYRGMSSSERRKREGNYLWKLKEERKDS